MHKCTEKNWKSRWNGYFLSKIQKSNLMIVEGKTKQKNSIDVLKLLKIYSTKNVPISDVFIEDV